MEEFICIVCFFMISSYYDNGYCLRMIRILVCVLLSVELLENDLI